MARWGFVRHGQSTGNAERWLAGQMDVPLTELGREQARAVQVRTEEWTRLVSSDLLRAHETARLALPQADFETTDQLRERTIGEWDGTPIDQLKWEGHWQVLLTWDGQPPGGESNQMLARRALTWLANQPDLDTLIFAHGGLIRTVTGLVDGLPLEEIPLRKIGNCTLHERQVSRERWAELRDSV